jgi:TolB protein
MDLWMMPVDGGEMTQMTTDPTPDMHPRWSPDGTEIAYVANASGNQEIWVMPVSGGPARQLTDSESMRNPNSHPAWSPDGREIAFTSTRDFMSDLYVIPIEGGVARQLATNLDTNWHVDWSPEGELLVVYSGRALWTIPAAGGDAELLTNGSAGYPRWSRDGSQVYYMGRNENAGNLWAVSLEDRSERALTAFEGRRGHLASRGLATDGRYLYFRWEEEFGDIWVMNVIRE